MVRPRLSEARSLFASTNKPEFVNVLGGGGESLGQRRQNPGVMFSEVTDADDAYAHRHAGITKPRRSTKVTKDLGARAEAVFVSCCSFVSS